MITITPNTVTSDLLRGLFSDRFGWTIALKLHQNPRDRPEGSLRWNSAGRHAWVTCHVDRVDRQASIFALSAGRTVWIGDTRALATTSSNPAYSSTHGQRTSRPSDEQRRNQSTARLAKSVCRISSCAMSDGGHGTLLSRRLREPT